MSESQEVRNEAMIRIRNQKNGDVMWVKYEQYGYVHYFHTGFMDYMGGAGIHGEGMSAREALQMFIDQLELYYESGP